MTKLLQQINESANGVETLFETIAANMDELFEGFSGSSKQLIAESAAKYLGVIAAQLKFKQAIEDFDKAVDMVTALRVLGSSENRDAFNIRLNTFKVLVSKAGEAQNVDAALSKLSHNPSVATVRQQVEAMLKSAVEKGENGVGIALQSINKLRLGYERVQNKLQSAEAADQAVQQPAGSRKTASAGPTAARTNPQAKPAQRPTDRKNVA